MNVQAFFDALDQEFCNRPGWLGDSENVSNIPERILTACGVPVCPGAVEYYTAYGDLCAEVSLENHLWFDPDASAWFPLY